MKDQRTYVEANRSAKIVTTVWVFAYFLAVVVAYGGAGNIWDKNADPGWRYFAIQVTWVLMWVGSFYTLYLAVVSMRHGVFLPTTAIVSTRTRQVKGFAAYAFGFLFLLVTASLIGIPFAQKVHISKVQKIMERMHDLGIVPTQGAGIIEARMKSRTRFGKKRPTYCATCF